MSWGFVDSMSQFIYSILDVAWHRVSDESLSQNCSLFSGLPSFTPSMHFPSDRRAEVMLLHLHPPSGFIFRRKEMKKNKG